MTTSPLPKPISGSVSGAEIDRTFGEGAPIAAPTSVTSEWRRYAGFLKRPALPEMGAKGTGVRAVLRLLILDMGFMVLFIGIVGALTAMGFEVPANVNNSLEPGLVTYLMVALLIPIAEELIFRSWLNGRPAIIAAVILAVAGLGLVVTGGTLAETTSYGNILTIVGVALAVIGAPLIAALLLKRPAFGVFERQFALFYWFSVISFALVHLANYTEGSLIILLPFVLPQFVLGTMLGYLRVHYGLIAAIALHALHNGLLFGLVMFGASASGGAS
ncbi:MAG: CPBP family glutamic-type intramembrane protease [Pseudomonadota bacterium]